MSKHTEVANDSKIETDDYNQLTNEGKEVPYEFDEVNKKWSAHYLPYTQYDPLEELARAIATDTVEFIQGEK